MKHIVFFSGGLGSFFTAKRVIESHGKENVILLFTDTMTEEEELHRFLRDAEIYFDIEITRIADGRDIWQLFKDEGFLGNSRLAPCSHILKQETAKKWIKERFKPDECILYLGLDWTEEHRTVAPRRNWYPYIVEFPMCKEPYVFKTQMMNDLEMIGIKLPSSYKLGFPHLNCQGFCVRAGQGNFKLLLEHYPDRFAHAEKMEKEVAEHIGKDVTILRKTVNGERVNYSLEELRKDYENNPDVIDGDDIGGCGCFSE